MHGDAKCSTPGRVPAGGNIHAAGLFQLGSPQLLIVVAGIVTVLTVCYIATSDEAYVRIFKLERMERTYGFKYGKLTIAFSGERYEVRGCSSGGWSDR